MKNKGWRREPFRHSLASRGISSMSQRGEIPLPRDFNGEEDLPLVIFTPDTLARVRRHNSISPDKEWIAELDLVNGNIIMNDDQFSDEVNMSWLKWDEGRDDDINVGYIHYHPDNLVPLFTAQDFVLGAKLHELRSRGNKGRFPYTLMGLVLDNRILLVAINPRPYRIRQFSECVPTDGLDATTDKLENIVGEMQKRGELVRYRDINLDGEYVERSEGLII